MKIQASATISLLINFFFFTLMKGGQYSSNNVTFRWEINADMQLYLLFSDGLI